MQKLIATGNLTKGAVKRYTESGKVVLDLNIAVNDYNGKEKTTLWLRGSLWGTRAESLEQYLVKGTKVFVEGKLLHQEGNPRLWGDPVRSSFEIIITDIELMGGKKQEEDDGDVSGF